MTETAPARSSTKDMVAIIVSIITAIGTVTVLMTALLMIGAWRGQVDAQLVQLGRRMDQAEANQKTYIPVLIGLSKDVTFLAERARREDERQDRHPR